MTYLPTELISAIAKDLSSEDFRQLRATDKRLKDVAEPGAFRQVKITNTSKSIDGLLHLLNGDHLRGLVEVLEFEEGSRPSDSGAIRYIPPDPVASTEADNEIHQQIQTAFTQLHRCPHLESLQLTFHEAYGVPVFDDISGNTLEEPPPSASIDLQRAVFSGLACLGGNYGDLVIRSFTVENLLPYTHASFAHTGLALLLSSLHSLSITINDASEEVGSYQAANLPPFYAESLPPVLRASRTLHTLRLSPRAIPLGSEYALDFSELNFSSLEELSLGWTLFDDGPYPSGPEESIVRHAGSLRSLELVYCSIERPLGDPEPGRHWADIWNRFAEELTLLTKLHVEWEVPKGMAGYQVGYCELESGVGYFPGVVVELEGALGDVPALEAFAETVKARDGGEVTIVETSLNEGEEKDEDEEE